MQNITQGWFEHNDSDTVIVFVHGIFSNNLSCFQNKKSKICTYWPTLVSEDKRISNTSIYLCEFYTVKDSNDYGVSDCAAEVLLQLKSHDEQLLPPAISKKNIVFIAHSTGGIVVRYLLESQRNIFKGKKIGLALYASPSYGSKLASSLGWIAKKFKNKLAMELSWGSEILDDLDGRFRDLLESKELNITGFEAYENRSPFHINFFNVSPKRVVEKQSASRYFGKPKLVPGSDHFSIVKPRDTSEYSHQILLEYLKDKDFISFNGKNCKELNIPSGIDDIDDSECVLFDFYKPCHEKHYVIRQDDSNFENNIKNSGVWLCGPSGVGKTSSIQRYIARSNSKFKYISLAACVNEPLEYIFNDILSNFFEDDIDEVSPQTITESIRRVAEKIIELCKLGPIYLLIEEIPIKEQATFVKFSEYIYSLLLLVARVDNFKLILSSIFEPAELDSGEFNKISERFKILKVSSWATEDMERLVLKIEGSLTDLDSEVHDIEAFLGSPRKAKIYYRELKTLSEIEMVNI